MKKSGNRQTGTDNNDSGYTAQNDCVPEGSAHEDQGLLFRLAIAVCRSNRSGTKPCFIGKKASGDAVSGSKEEGTAKNASGY